MINFQVKRVYFLVLIVILAGCGKINKQQIVGKWYIIQSIDVNTDESLDFSFIECPYLLFDSNGEFCIEHGMNYKTEHWRIEKELLIIDYESGDSSILKIQNLTDTSMQLLYQDEGVLMELRRHCSNR